MTQHDPKTPRPVKIEELLRLKQAERPPSDFWATWDVGLREKQLSALVVRRPWWEPLAALWRRGGRLALPASAAAVMALGMFMLRHPTSSSNDVAPSPAPQSLAVAPATSPSTQPAPVSVAMDSSSQAAPKSQPVRASTPAVSAPGDSDWGEVVPLSPAITGAKVAAADTPPSVRRVRENFDAARSVVPSIVEGLDRDLPLGATVRPAYLAGVTDHSPFTTVASVDVPVAANRADSRVERLLALADETERPASMSARLLQADGGSALQQKAMSRLSDDSMYDEVHRLGVGGDRVSFRF